LNRLALFLFAVLVGCATTQTNAEGTLPTFDKPVERAIHSTVLVQDEQERTYCSGTLVKKTRHILSAAHCFPPGQTFSLVGLHGRYGADVVHLDLENDIALLRPRGVEIRLRDGVPLARKPGRMGESVFALGHAKGDAFPFTLTSGIISYPHRKDSAGHYVQATSPLVPGMSGGGFYNSRGELLGANLFVWTLPVHCMFPPCGAFQDSPMYGFSYHPLIKDALQSATK